MTIHTALIVEQSPALRSLVTGPMEEAQNHTVIWDDVDEDTFTRFAQFVYTGDYIPAPHIFVPTPVKESENEVESKNDIVEIIEEPEQSAAGSLDAFEGPTIAADFDSYETVGFAKRDKKKREKKSSRRLGFNTLVYPTPSYSANILSMCESRPNMSAEEDYTPVLVGHARLYVFADRYGIGALKALVLNKLHFTLCNFTPYQVRYGDVLELVSYTYDNTVAGIRSGDLRDLVLRYLVCESAKRILRSKQCLSLIEDGGPFASDLCLMLID